MTAKAVLYAYRVVCTGIHLMRTGDVVTDLRTTAPLVGVNSIETLIESKVAEKIAFQFDVEKHLKKVRELEEVLTQSFEHSQLPEQANRESVDEFLIRLRLGSKLTS